MAIRSIKIANVMAFQRAWRENADGKISDSFYLDFTDGINVVIGENGCGKTTLLKMIYAATQWSNQETDVGKTDKITKFFSYNLHSNDPLKNTERKDDYCAFEVSDGEHTFTYSLSHNGIIEPMPWFSLNFQSVFIPTMEMLSHSKGFLALNQKFKLPFDGTQVDIIVNASLPEVREMTTDMDGILEKISKAIEGTVIQEDDIFYVIKNDGRKIEFSLEAEGLRKLGLIWKLIRNGLLEKDSILIWDEPEANLNPELYSLVADILLELQKNGVQIFVATHSYNFAKYLEIRRSYEEQVQFHNLYRDESNVICSDTAYTMEGLEQNHIMIADNNLLDEVFDV